MNPTDAGLSRSIPLELLASLAGEIGNNRDAPRFGDIFHGQLKTEADQGGRRASMDFGNGKPHYALVRGSMRIRLEPLVPFAPITSQRRKGDKVLVLPKGILPRRDGSGLVDSYVLLFWPPIRISLRRVRSDFRKITELPPHLAHEAQRMISTP